MEVLLKSLAIVQKELKAPKAQRNNFGNYNYRSCEDILEAVKPLLFENDLVMTISDDIKNIGDRYYVEATVQIFHTNGDSKIVKAYARESLDKKGMDSAQVTGAASSYARKYALNGMFAIDDTKDADTMDNSKPSKKPPQKTFVPSKDKSVTDQQKVFIGNLLRQKGVEGKEAIQEYLADNYGILPESFMSQADAQMVIDDFKENK